MRLLFGLYLIVPLLMGTLAQAGQYPGGFREYQGGVSFCTEEASARHLMEVRKFGLTVAEDSVQMLMQQVGRDGKPLCRLEWIDIRHVNLGESIDLGVVFPIDSAPFRAWILHVRKDSVHYWILWTEVLINA